MEQKNRNSNIELLRIISMLFIVAGHFIEYAYFGENPMIVNDLSVESVIFQELMQFARMSCSIFAMISGFFLVRGGINRIRFFQ